MVGLVQDLEKLTGRGSFPTIRNEFDIAEVLALMPRIIKKNYTIN